MAHAPAGERITAPIPLGIVTTPSADSPAHLAPCGDKHRRRKYVGNCQGKITRSLLFPLAGQYRHAQVSKIFSPKTMKSDATIGSLIQRAATVSFPDTAGGPPLSSPIWLRQKYNNGRPNDSEPSSTEGTVDASRVILSSLRQPEDRLFGTNLADAVRIFRAWRSSR